MNIGVVFDLRTEYLAQGFSEEEVAEFDSEATINAIEDALCKLGHNVERIGNGRNLCKLLVGGKRWDLIFNIAEGLRGRSREAQVPSILELFDIPYTFSDPLTCAITLDKALTKRIVSTGGIPTPEYKVVKNFQDIDNINLPFPLFAKPVAEGTGKGIDRDSRIESYEQLQNVCTRLLKKYKQPVLIEKYLPGREFTVGIIGTDKNARVIGSMEIKIKDKTTTGDYSFHAKEECEELVIYTPMEHGKLRKRVEEIALEAYKILECRDAGRVDIRLDGNNEPYFLEINPLPGLHPTHSDLPMIATQEGMSYIELIGSIINSAMERIKNL
jgi:D-alanine-D-alanine ligase